MLHLAYFEEGGAGAIEEIRDTGWPGIKPPCLPPCLPASCFKTGQSRGRLAMRTWNKGRGINLGCCWKKCQRMKCVSTAPIHFNLGRAYLLWHHHMFLKHQGSLNHVNSPLPSLLCILILIIIFFMNRWCVFFKHPIALSLQWHWHCKSRTTYFSTGSFKLTEQLERLQANYIYVNIKRTHVLI